MALFVFSIINYNSARQTSYDPTPPPDAQRRYAITVSTVTLVITGAVLIMHLDRFTPLYKKVWSKFFAPKSKAELILLLFLAAWWGIATWINTTAGGIAGEGSLQLNLYFSTWVCVIDCFWTIERFRKAAGQISTQRFLSEMPARSAGWAVVLVTNLLLFSFAANLDNYVHGLPTNTTGNETYPTNLYEVYVTNPPPEYQWYLILTVSSLSWIIGLLFVLLELFRSKRQKSDAENIFEGILLFILTLFWIPTVTIVTVPGGIAQLLGNTYFWSWAATVAVLRTFSWWIRDWRESIHDMIEVQLIEYERAKRQALKQSAEEAFTNNTNTTAEGNNDPVSNPKAVESGDGQQDKTVRKQGSPEPLSSRRGMTPPNRLSVSPTRSPATAGGSSPDKK